MVNEICNGALGALAGNQQEMAGAARLERADGDAGTVDDRVVAAALPAGERLTLAHYDVELIGIDAVDAGALDPVDVLHHAAGPPGIEADQRAAELDADGGQDLLGPVALETGDPDLLGREADDMGKAGRELAQRSLIRFEMAAGQQPIDDGEADEDQGGAARQDVWPQRLGTAPCGAAMLVQRLSDASSISHCTSSCMLWPACWASSGTSEVPVIPGCVLTSRI